MTDDAVDVAEAQNRIYQRWKAAHRAPSEFYNALRRCGIDLARVDTRIGNIPVSLVIRPSGHLYRTDRLVGDAWRTLGQVVSRVLESATCAYGTAPRVMPAEMPDGILHARCRVNGAGGLVTVRIGDMRQMDTASRRQVRYLFAADRGGGNRHRPWFGGLAAVPGLAGAAADAVAKKALAAPVAAGASPAVLSVATAALVIGGASLPALAPSPAPEHLQPTASDHVAAAPSQPHPDGATPGSTPTGPDARPQPRSPAGPPPTARPGPDRDVHPSAAPRRHSGHGRRHLPGRPVRQTLQHLARPDAGDDSGPKIEQPQAGSQQADRQRPGRQRSGPGLHIDTDRP